jgi:hypothetical protein
VAFTELAQAISTVGPTFNMSADGRNKGALEHPQRTMEMTVVAAVVVHLRW